MRGQEINLDPFPIKTRQTARGSCSQIGSAGYHTQYSRGPNLRDPVPVQTCLHAWQMDQSEACKRPVLSEALLISQACQEILDAL